MVKCIVSIVARVDSFAESRLRRKSASFTARSCEHNCGPEPSLISRRGDSWTKVSASSAICAALSGKRSRRSTAAIRFRRFAHARLAHRHRADEVRRVISYWTTVVIAIDFVDQEVP